MRMKPNSSGDFHDVFEDCSYAMRRALRHKKVDSLEKLLELTADDCRDMNSCGPEGLRSLRYALWRKKLMLKGDKVIAIIGCDNEAGHLMIVGDVEMD